MGDIFPCKYLVHFGASPRQDQDWIALHFLGLRYEIERQVLQGFRDLLQNSFSLLNCFCSSGKIAHRYNDCNVTVMIFTFLFFSNT